MSSASAEHEPPCARIRVRASPGAARTQVQGRYGDGWKVRIAAAPERGKANSEICAFLAQVAGLRQRDVAVVTGAASRDKLIELRGIDLATLQGLLDAASGK